MATPAFATPFTMTTPDSVNLGSVSVPVKGTVLFAAILLTDVLAGAQVRVDPAATVIDGATTKLAPDGAEQV